VLIASTALIKMQEKKAQKAQRVTDEDINALALYLLDHPRGKMTIKNYYIAFQAQVSEFF
jgi:hypothetical protein